MPPLGRRYGDDMKNTVFGAESEIYFDRSSIGSNSGSARHYHELFEIYYLKEGHCRYFIDNRVFEVEKGDVVLIPESVIHKTNYDGEEHTRLLLNVARSYIPSEALLRLPKLSYLYRNAEALPEIDLLFARMEEEVKRSDELSREAIRALVALLFCTMLRHENGFAAAKESGSELIESCVKYVRENYMHAISLSEAARIHSVSPEHLSRSFKRETGIGFNEFIGLVRLRRAELMLRNESGRSIAEIAYACGFNDSNYFSDKFKKLYGVTPSELRHKLSSKQ